MTYLLDSDVVIDYFKKRQPSFGIVVSLLEKEHIVISAITLAEVRGGWDITQAAKFRPLIDDLFSVVEVTAGIADLAGEQLKRYAQQGKKLSTTDTLIGATAIANDYCLLTRNIKDFPMPELKLYKDLFSNI